jgi:hypothetical protein
MHRAFLPTETDLTLALDIVEGVLAPIYDHRISVKNAIHGVQFGRFDQLECAMVTAKSLK